MKTIIDMSADRGAFVCQSQSLNLWLEDPTYNALTSMHFYSWKKGLKTGMYYLRRKAKHQAQQFTIEPDKNTNEMEDVCEMCSAQYMLYKIRINKKLKKGFVKSQMY